MSCNGLKSWLQSFGELNACTVKLGQIWVNFLEQDTKEGNGVRSIHPTSNMEGALNHGYPLGSLRTKACTGDKIQARQKQCSKVSGFDIQAHNDKGGRADLSARLND